MDAVMVVIEDLLVDEVDEFTERVKPIEIPSFRFEMAVKRLLVPILPRRAFRAHGELSANRLNQPHKLGTIVF